MSCVQGHSYKPHTVCTYYFYHSLLHDPLFLLGGPGNETRVEVKKATLLTLKTIHKCIHKMGPTYLHEKFIKPSDMGNSRTRGASKLYLHRPRTDFIRTLLKYSGAKLWNSLPASVRDVTSRLGFPHALQHYFDSS